MRLLMLLVGGIPNHHAFESLVGTAGGGETHSRNIDIRVQHAALIIFTSNATPSSYYSTVSLVDAR